MARTRRAALAAAIVVTLWAPAGAQQTTYSPVTQADIQRLQDNVYQASMDVQQLRSRDANRAAQLQAELDDLRDEVVYLKVKLRKDGTLGRSEYAGVRDRIEDVRTRSAPPVAAARNPARAPRVAEIPAGTEMDVRLTDSLNSGTAKVEDRFEGSTLIDVEVGGRTIIPAGSVVRGVVTAVDPATRTNRTAKMTVSFDQVTANNRAYPIRGTVTQAIEGQGVKGESGRIAAGAGVGAVIGGLLGGFKGALAGILVGGGGTLAATEGKQVELPQGAVLRVRIDSAVPLDAAPR